MKVVVTGISGHLGSVLAQGLSTDPRVDRITGVSRHPGHFRHPKLRHVSLDVRDPHLADLMSGHDAVVHAASVVLWRYALPPAERERINIDGTRNVALSAQRARVGRFIHISSIGAYDLDSVRGMSDVTEAAPLGTNCAPFYYYWREKAQQERLLQQVFGDGETALALLRLGYVFGPQSTDIARLWRRQSVRVPGRNPRFQFLHEDDAVAAVSLALHRVLRGAYNVVPGDHVEQDEVLSILRAKALWLPCSTPAMLGAWCLWRFFGGQLHPSWVQGHFANFTCDITKLRAEGWEPRFSSRDALRACSNQLSLPGASVTSMDIRPVLARFREVQE